jgi:hypothetical protein
MSTVYTTAAHVRRPDPTGSRTRSMVDGVIPGEDNWS